MSGGLVVHLGAEQGPHVRVTAIARAYPGGLGELRGWIQAEIKVRSPAANWRFDAFLREQELARFLDEVRALRAGATHCELAPRDPWVALVLERRGDGSGFRARGFAHEPDSERQAELECVLADTEVARLEAELDAMLRGLPPAAAPGD